MSAIVPMAAGWDWLFPKSWGHPERLWWLLIVPVFVAVYILAQLLRRRTAMRFTNTTVLARVIQRRHNWLRHVAVAMSLSSLLTLIVAYAIPRALDKVPRERATVVIVLDVSLSMRATDVKPSRIEAAKEAAGRFADELRDGYNVAVVSLSGNPAVRLPPTTDHAAARRSITMLELQESTATGDAIIAALTAISQAPKADDGSVAPASIVLLSDGQNTAGRSPMQAADQARLAKVPIYTVAYGTQVGYVDLDGKREPVPPDLDLLREIARLTGGESVSAENPAELRQAYEGLHSKVGYELVPSEVTAQWAGFGVLFGLLAAVAAVLMAARWA